MFTRSATWRQSSCATAHSHGGATLPHVHLPQCGDAAVVHGDTLRWQLRTAVVGILRPRPLRRSRRGVERNRHRQSTRRRRHPRLHGVGAAADGAAAWAARRRTRHTARQRACLHRQRLPLLRRYHGGVRAADDRSETVRNVADHCLRPLRGVPRHAYRLLTRAVYRAAHQRPLLPQLIGQRHDRQSDLRLLLGH